MPYYESTADRLNRLRQAADSMLSIASTPRASGGPRYGPVQSQNLPMSLHSLEQQQFNAPRPVQFQPTSSGEGIYRNSLTSSPLNDLESYTQANPGRPAPEGSPVRRTAEAILPTLGTGPRSEYLRSLALSAIEGAPSSATPQLPGILEQTPALSAAIGGANARAPGIGPGLLSFASAPVLPTPLTEQLANVPVVGPSLQHGIEGATTPLGLATLGGLGGVAPAVRSVAGATALGTIGRESGLPYGQTAGELAGGLGGPFISPALERAGVSAAQRLGTAAERNIASRPGGLASEVGGSRFNIERKINGKTYKGTGSTLAEAQADAEAQALGAESRVVGAPPSEPPTGPLRSGEPPNGPPSDTLPIGDFNLPRPSALKSVAETAQTIREGTQTAAGGIGRQVSRIPGARGATSLVNPSAAEPAAGVVKEIGQQGARDLQDALIGYEALGEAQSSISSAIETGIRQRMRAVGIKYNPGQGTISNETGVLGPTGDVFENPSLYRNRLTPEQRQFMDEVTNVLEDQNQAELAAGVDKGQVFSEEGKYFPRQVTAVNGEQRVRGVVRRSVGATQGFQKERFYETMAQGIAEGKTYAGDPAGLVGARLRSGMKAIRDKQIEDIALQYKQAPGFNTTGTKIPGLGGAEFGPETANIINEALAQHPIEPGLAALNLPNRLMRTLEATGDISAGGIQILKSLFIPGRQVAFAKSMGAGLDALITDSRWFGKYISNNAREIEDFTRAGGLVDTNEFAISDIFAGKGTTETALHKVTSRFDAAFQNMQTVNSLESYKAMVGLADSEPGLWSEFSRTLLGDTAKGTNREQAAAIANKLSGRTTTRGIGIQGTQRQAEQFLAFAPRYMRALTSLYTDAIQGGLRGAEARKALLGFWGGVTLTYIAAAKALGQEPMLNPLNAKNGGDGAKFFTLELGGQRVGLGGLDQRLVRLFADAAADPSTLTQFDLQNNPALKFARGSTSPTVGLATDVISGSNYLGEPVTSPEDIAARLGKSVVPFGISSAIQEGPQALPPQFLGLRSFPNPPTEAEKAAASAQRPASEEIAAREQQYNLPNIASDILKGNDKAAPEFLKRYQDLQSDASFQSFINTLGIQFLDPQTPEGQAIQAWRDVKSSDPKYEDPDTHQIDYAQYEEDKTAAFKALPQEVQDAYNNRLLTTDPASQQVEQRLKQAQQLRSGLFDVPKYEGLSPDEYRVVLKFKQAVSDYADEQRTQYGKNDTAEFLRNLLAPQFDRTGFDGDANTLIAWAKAVGSQKEPLNPAYINYLRDNQKVLQPFYPDLYKNNQVQDAIAKGRR